ncbi:G5 domain-containing protein [Dysosmobacter sp.]|uniref:G5 and 3D domain-containing protein n=1 Tax=Dysosmobacter sp. TaxID=2591382 RepID=UPI003A91E2F8
MNRTNLLIKLHQLKRRYGLPLFVAATVVCVSWISMDHANALYILTGTEDSAIVLDDETTATREISSQLVYLSEGQTGSDLALTAKQTVTIQRNGETVSTQAKKGETVSDLLERIHMIPGPLEMVAVDVSDDGVEVTVASELTYYEEISEDVAYETVRVANPGMEKGTEKVVQEGKNGVRTSVYEVIWSNGQELSRQFVEELDSTVVDKIVEYGTAPEATVNINSSIASVKKNTDGSGTLTLADGSTLSFSGVKSMIATAYTAGHGGADYTTATGTLVRVGTVAVDKSVIPLGTRMYIVSNDGSVVYGLAVAEDTGVRGNVVDLYYNTYEECINFGRRGCTVYILE